MTTFAKLKTMSDAAIQDWLGKVGVRGVKTLVKAMLGADEKVRDCILRNMSPRAAMFLKRDLAAGSAKGAGRAAAAFNAWKLERLM